MSIWVLIVLLIPFHQTILCTLLVPTENFSTCFVKVSNLIFGKSSTVAYVFDKKIDVSSLNLRNNPYVLIDVTKPMINTGGYVNHYVISTDSVNGLKKTWFYLAYSKIWNDKSYALGHFLVVSSHKNVSELFQYLWQQGIFNVVILKPSKTNSVVYQSDPYSIQNNCGTQTIAVKSNVCKFIKSIIFKRTNFNSCPLWLINTNIENPYILPSLKYGLHLIHLISLNFNITVNHYTLADIRLFPFYLFKRSTIAVFIGANTPFNEFVSSERYLIHNFVWLVPLPRQMSAIEALVHIFQLELWILVIASTIVTVFVLWLLSIFVKEKYFVNDLYNIAVNLICVTIWGTISKVPKNNGLRCIIIIYMIYAVHIQTAYTSGLIKALTVPLYDHGIQSVNDLATSTLRIYSHNYTVSNLLLADINSTLMSKINSKFVNITSAGNLWEISTFRNSSALVSEQLLNQMGNLFKSIRIIRNNSIVRTIDEVFKMRPGHHFLQNINYFIKTIFESGINNKLWNDMIIRFYQQNHLTISSNAEVLTVIILCQASPSSTLSQDSLVSPPQPKLPAVITVENSVAPAIMSVPSTSKEYILLSSIQELSKAKSQNRQRVNNVLKDTKFYDNQQIKLFPDSPTRTLQSQNQITDSNKDIDNISILVQPDLDNQTELDLLEIIIEQNQNNDNLIDDYQTIHSNAGSYPNFEIPIISIAVNYGQNQIIINSVLHFSANPKTTILFEK
ncbi:hypothetical protein RN001_011903 [Aquatica leii]|uniref:Ionotropic glutamate receptor C-terminal domain-containing protein n=1 Tax=Aquatica leii TaxID=1421715 RepID=A0AAN7P6J2_9COLE|nr:hypothetical protein RN001_011903 [Aquatica leii]